MKVQSKKIHIDFELEQFIEELNYEIDSKTYVEGDGVFKEDIFSTHILDLLSESGDTEGPVLCNYSRLNERGNLDFKINAYAIKENNESLDLFITSYRDTNKLYNLNKAETQGLLRQLSRFAANCLKGYDDTIDKAHPAYNLCQDIKKQYKRFDRINLFVLTNGHVAFDPPQDHEIKGFDEIAVLIHIWDIERIYRLAKSNSGREPIEIDFEQLFEITLPCLRMPVENEVYECYLAIVPGGILAALYRNYSTRLLESNVRAFLQQTGSVNKGIKDTILQKPYMFLPYNNGLAVTAQGVNTRIVNGRLEITAIKDLQIVNGGQTTASLFHTEKKNRAKLDDVYVQMKLTVIKDEALKAVEVPNISRFANSQNKVSELDLTSNHPYLQRIEELSRTTYAIDPSNPNRQTLWFFERVKGQYREMINKESKKSNQEAYKYKFPTSQVFSKSDIAKYMNVWNRLPYLVSRGAQKNYVAFLDSVHKELGKKLPNRVFYEDLIANAILFIATDELFGRKNRDAIGDTNLKSFTVAYTLSYFHEQTENRLNLKNIWDAQSVHPTLLKFLSKLIRRIYKFLTADKNGLISETAKSEKFWNLLKQADLDIDCDEVEEFLMTEEEYEVRYSEDNDTLDEAKHYNKLQRISAAGLKFWDALPLFLISREDFSSPKKNFADIIKRKLKTTGELSEIDIKHGIEILDKLDEMGISIESIKANSKIKDDISLDISSIYTRLKKIDDKSWARIIDLGRQTGVLDSKEISVVKTASKKLKANETIDINMLTTLEQVLEQVKRFGIKY